MTRDTCSDENRGVKRGKLSDEGDNLCTPK